MKIINLKAQNIKKLVAVDITPDDNTIVITGKNGAGKSSILDSIFWALAGTTPIQEKPIREGEQTASIKLDLGELKVERNFTAKGTTLKVTQAQGGKITNGQETLNKLLGAITFDPLQFSRMPAKDQFETLRKLAKIDLNLTELDRLNSADYDKRREINRQVDQLTADVNTAQAEVKTDLADPIDVVDTVNKLEVCRLGHRKLIDLEQAADRLAEAAIDTGREIFELEARLADLKKLQENTQSNCDEKIREAENMKVVIESQPELYDEAALTATLNEAQAVNTAHQTNELAKQRLTLKQQQLAETTAASEALTAAMETRTAQKREAIANAEMPIPGLSFVEGVVYLNDQPFNQASSAEQLRVSTAICMAMNPTLRVMIVRDGSLLDTDSMKMLKDMVKDRDFQLWIETVERTEAGALVIEEGKVKS